MASSEVYMDCENVFLNQPIVFLIRLISSIKTYKLMFRLKAHPNSIRESVFMIPGMLSICS